MELLGASYCRATATHAKLVEDAPGMRTHGAQRHRELAGDFGAAQVGCEQPKDVELAFAQRLDQSLDRGYSILSAAEGRQKPPNVIARSLALGYFQECQHRRTFVHKHANVTFRLS